MSSLVEGGLFHKRRKTWLPSVCATEDGDNADKTGTVRLLDEDTNKKKGKIKIAPQRLQKWTQVDQTPLSL